MNRISMLIVILASIFMFAKGQDYSVDNIPEELKKNARSIVRQDKQVLTLLSEGRATMDCNFVITVMNKSGEEDAVFRKGYDKFVKLRVNSAVAYDKNGKKIKSYRGDDIIDISAISGFSTYEDNRMKLIEPAYNEFPYTLVYNFTYNFNGTLQLPTWHPYIDYDIAIQNSSLEVHVPSDMEIRYLENNISEKAQVITEKSGSKVYKWQVSDLPAIKYEPFSNPIQEYLPTIFLAMNDFKIAGRPGNASTWEDFGKWVYNLNSTRRDLHPETVAKFKELVEELDDDSKKVRMLYKYLQDNTRYVSVQVGIGGWQAFDAETVDRLGYGDCKALSNYMQAAFESIGIDAYYTIVNAGSYAHPVISHFPSNQFNHAFLCVPLANDTLWLECTSQTAPCGFLGTFTDDRNVLIIKEDGGHMVRTKAYTAQENNLSTRATVNLTPEGKGHVGFERTYKGLFYKYGDKIMSSDDGDKKKLMYKYIDIPHFDLTKYKHEANKERLPWIVESVSLELGNYATIMGSNMFLTLNLMNRIDDSPKEVRNRLSDVYIRRSYSENDTITYILPEGFLASGIPGEINIESKFGKYNCKVVQEEEEGKLTYIRNFELQKGTHPKEEYPDLIAFYDKIVSADQKKIALKRSE